MFGGPGNGKDTSLDTSTFQVGKIWTLLFSWGGWWSGLSSRRPSLLPWSLLQLFGAGLEEWDFWVLSLSVWKNRQDMQSLVEHFSLGFSGNVRFLSMWHFVLRRVGLNWFCFRTKWWLNSTKHYFIFLFSLVVLLMV